MTVYIPSALRSYTKQRSEVAVEGQTLAEVLSALDHRYPGLRFRIITEQGTIRQHIRIFVKEEQVRICLLRFNQRIRSTSSVP